MLCAGQVNGAKLRSLSVGLAFAVTLAAAVLVSEPTPRAILPLPAPGEVAAEWLNDGTPVFVVHHDGGEVDVLKAEYPTSTKLAAVAWCPPIRLFVGVLTGSLFTSSGEYAGGPAPTGLTSYRNSVRAGLVHVGERLGTPPRAPEASTSISYNFVHPCWTDTLDLDPQVVVLHGYPYTDATTVEQVVRNGKPGTFTVHAVMLDHPNGDVELCSELTDVPSSPCHPPSLRRAARRPGSGSFWVHEGYLRGTVDRNMTLHKIVFVGLTDYRFADNQRLN